MFFTRSQPFDPVRSLAGSFEYNRSIEIPFIQCSLRCTACECYLYMLLQAGDLHHGESTCWFLCPDGCSEHQGQVQSAKCWDKKPDKCFHSDKIYVSKIKDNQTAAKLLSEKLQPVVCQDTTDGGVSILAASGLSLINVLCNR